MYIKKERERERARSRALCWGVDRIYRQDSRRRRRLSFLSDVVAVVVVVSFPRTDRIDRRPGANGFWRSTPVG